MYRSLSVHLPLCVHLLVCLQSNIEVAHWNITTHVTVDRWHVMAVVAAMPIKSSSPTRPVHPRVDATPKNFHLFPRCFTYLVPGFTKAGSWPASITRRGRSQLKKRKSSSQPSHSQCEGPPSSKYEDTSRSSTTCHHTYHKGASSCMYGGLIWISSTEHQVELLIVATSLKSCAPNRHYGATGWITTHYFQLRESHAHRCRQRQNHGEGLLLELRRPHELLMSTDPLFLESHCHLMLL